MYIPIFPCNVKGTTFDFPASLSQNERKKGSQVSLKANEGDLPVIFKKIQVLEKIGTICVTPRAVIYSTDMQGVYVYTFTHVHNMRDITRWYSTHLTKCEWIWYQDVYVSIFEVLKILFIDYRLNIYNIKCACDWCRTCNFESVEELNLFNSHVFKWSESWLLFGLHSHHTCMSGFTPHVSGLCFILF